MKIVFNGMEFPHTRLYADGNINCFEVLHDPVEISYTAIFNGNELQGSYKMHYHEYQSMTAIEIAKLLEGEVVRMVSEEELKPPDDVTLDDIPGQEFSYLPFAEFNMTSVDLSELHKSSNVYSSNQSRITVKDKLLGIVTSIPNSFYKKRKR